MHRTGPLGIHNATANPVPGHAKPAVPRGSGGFPQPVPGRETPV